MEISVPLNLEHSRMLRRWKVSWISEFLWERNNELTSEEFLFVA
jgi:hypothetical protein